MTNFCNTSHTNCLKSSSNLQENLLNETKNKFCHMLSFFSSKNGQNRSKMSIFSENLDLFRACLFFCRSFQSLQKFVKSIASDSEKLQDADRSAAAATQCSQREGQLARLASQASQLSQMGSSDKIKNPRQSIEALLSAISDLQLAIARSFFFYIVAAVRLRSWLKCSRKAFMVKKNVLLKLTVLVNQVLDNSLEIKISSKRIAIYKWQEWCDSFLQEKNMLLWFLSF